jgi:hypothetical protein
MNCIPLLCDKDNRKAAQEVGHVTQSSDDGKVIAAFAIAPSLPDGLPNTFSYS